MKQLKMKQKEKSGFLRMLLGILAASLLGNVLAGKWVKWINGYYFYWHLIL